MTANDPLTKSERRKKGGDRMLPVPKYSYPIISDLERKVCQQMLCTLCNENNFFTTNSMHILLHVQTKIKEFHEYYEPTAHHVPDNIYSYCEVVYKLSMIIFWVVTPCGLSGR
jgi:hypothetical protein